MAETHLNPPEPSLKANNPRSHNPIRDLHGAKVGKLLVTRFLGHLRIGASTQNVAVWECVCDCGNTTRKRARILLTPRSGHMSCGCTNGRTRIEQLHGCADLPDRKLLIGVWTEIKRRCSNPKAKRYDIYGGRGIRVCEFIMNSFENFISIVGERPRGNYQIDRKDNNGHYSCGQCEECRVNCWTENISWVTPTTNVRNRSITKWIAYKGENRPLAEWCEKLELPYETIRQRIHLKWSVERAFEQSVRRHPTARQPRCSQSTFLLD